MKFLFFIFIPGEACPSVRDRRRVVLPVGTRLDTMLAKKLWAERIV